MTQRGWIRTIRDSDGYCCTVAVPPKWLPGARADGNACRYRGQIPRHRIRLNDPPAPILFPIEQELDTAIPGVVAVDAMPIRSPCLAEVCCSGRRHVGHIHRAGPMILPSHRLSRTTAVKNVLSVGRARRVPTRLGRYQADIVPSHEHHTRHATERTRSYLTIVFVFAPAPERDQYHRQVLFTVTFTCDEVTVVPLAARDRRTCGPALAVVVFRGQSSDVVSSVPMLLLSSERHAGNRPGMA